MKFEEVLKSMEQMSSAEMKTRVEEAAKKCICGRCPSLVGTGETDMVFCLTEKSKIIKKESGCLCPGCPVQSSMGLRWQYYCTKGSGKERLERDLAKKKK